MHDQSTAGGSGTRRGTCERREVRRNSLTGNVEKGTVNERSDSNRELM